ncbi:hypothetical protein GGF32_005296 [Allomyces javanicus]|nr:hypothetical protein GGF32_005296 [Allomyces javanicus]
MFTSILEHAPLSLSSVNLSLGWHMNVNARLTVLRALAKVLSVLPSLRALALDGYVTIGLDEVMAVFPRASITFRSISVAMTKNMQYSENDFDVSNRILLELATALPVVTDALKLYLPWWTEEMAQAIPIAPTLRCMSFGHSPSILTPFPLALVVSRLPKGLIAFEIRNCTVSALNQLTTSDEAFPSLEELVLHNVLARDESDPDALTDDMNLVEMLLAIFASDRLRILDLDDTKAVHEDAGWVDLVPRSVRSLMMRVHKLDNKDLVDALLKQYAGATAGRCVHQAELLGLLLVGLEDL